MIVYGDSSRLELASDVAASVRRGLWTADYMAPGIGRHAAFVGAFIRAGELVQGIADAEFESSGFDTQSSAREAGSVLLLAMATEIDRSWKSGFAADANMRLLLNLLAKLDAAGWIRTKTGEGFAHYALYPEGYLAAARSSGLGAQTCVVGIRSIGTALAALVGAAIGARRAISVRPVGHPFDREIRAAPDLLAGADMRGDFAIVDEGPGLSGSSFASVAKWLASQGVEKERIHFFPSHGGAPGPAATIDARLVWQQCRRHPASLDVLCGASGLQDWVAESVGPLDGRLRSCSVPQGTPQDSRFVRQKFLARSTSGSWLVKFCGLGQTGEQKLWDARALGQAGFAPKTHSLCYGFLVQEWLEGRPATMAHYCRRGFIEHLGAYFAFRASHLGEPGSGASFDELREMASQNSSEVLGGAAARKIEARLAGFDALAGRARSVRTDNRVHAWEWLAMKGRLLKLDAVDHCCGHDLIGCQDIAWDVAGAIAEHNLGHDETDILCRSISRRGVAIDGELTSALLPCYLAFQLGLWSTATGEKSRHTEIIERYANKLSRLLDGVSVMDPPLGAPA